MGLLRVTLRSRTVLMLVGRQVILGVEDGSVANYPGVEGGFVFVASYFGVEDGVVASYLGADNCQQLV